MPEPVEVAEPEVVDAAPESEGASVPYRVRADNPVPEDDANGADVEAPPGIDTAPVTPLPAPLRLAVLRKADGSFDEDKIEEAYNRAEQTSRGMADFQRAYATNPEFRLATIKHLKASGEQLTPQQQSELDASAAPAKPEPTDAQYAAHYKKLREDAKISGDWDAVLEFKDVMEERARSKERAEREAERQAAQAERQRQEQTVARQAELARDAREAREAARDFSDLWVKDAKMAVGYRCTDPEVLAKVSQLQVAFPEMSLKDATETACAVLKKLKSGKATVAATVPAARNVKVMPRKSDPAPGEARVQYRTRVN